jgi:hypothetical protein
MEIELAQKLLSFFFKAPLVNALLVFEDNEYFGVVFKRDIEMGLREGNFQLFENISTIRAEELTTVLFAQQVSSGTVIPVIDKVGNLNKIISYEEFESHFHFDRFIADFSVAPVIESLDTPIMVTNHFKRILYMNRGAYEIAEKDFTGWNIGSLLKQFEIEISGDKMLVTAGEMTYQLHIHFAMAENFSYHVYQFIPV